MRDERDERDERIDRCLLTVVRCQAKPPPLTVVCCPLSVVYCKVTTRPTPFVTFCHLAFEKRRIFALQELVFQCVRRLKKNFKI